jgi:hypothetical protein
MTQLETYKVAAYDQPSEDGNLNLDDTNLKANPTRIGLILNQHWSNPLPMRM